MSNARTAAIAAYDAACSSPVSADWRAVAEMLRAALSPRSAGSDPSLAWWADYPLPKAYQTDSVDVLFYDGETVRANLFTAPRKPARIAATIRTAIAFYRARTGAEAVPPIASVTRVSNGATFDARACSDLTAELRTKDGGRIERDGPRAVTSESIARLTQELERRRVGLERIRRGDTAFTSADGAAWEAAVRGAEQELARMHGVYGEPEAAPAPAADPLTWDALFCNSVSAGAAIEQHAQPVEAMAQAQPVETASDYSDPIPAPVEAVEAVEATGSETGPALSACAENAQAAAVTESAPEYAQDDEWRPSAETHPVIVLCLSERARAELFDRVQDGTWPAAGREAKGGAWRLTLADALDLQGLKSARFVGMPRKAYTRRPTAPPVEAIATPVEAIPSFVPSPAFIPGTAFPDGAIVLHQPAR